MAEPRDPFRPRIVAFARISGDGGQAVIASAAKRSSAALEAGLDCLVAVLLAMTAAQSWIPAHRNDEKSALFRGRDRRRVLLGGLLGAEDVAPMGAGGHRLPGAG